MKGFSFDSFIVHDTNQAAYDVCNKLASLEKDMPRPIVLLGESGSGKSHLLWAIVNQFRERNDKVGVALISSKDFPNKVKKLPDTPEKLKKKYPVILIVDELHLFENNVADLERVIAAFQEYKQFVIIATNIHPSILPALSGKFKSYINGGSIIGIKPLPKSDGAPIPEVAVKQIATLKARIADLESSKEETPAVPEQNQQELKSLQQELETITHERDVARTALERSEGELIDLRDELSKLQEAPPTDTPDVAEIVDRLEKQKSAMKERIGGLEKQVEELIEFTDNLSKDIGDDESEKNREQLSEDQEEADLLRVIDGIRDTLKVFEEEEVETPEDKEASEAAHKTLATIFEQLQTLDMLPKEKKTEPVDDDDIPTAEEVS
ncbi:MAG: AAA family ATPase [Candidatus Hydrogenedentes bacterium]|nr:AAA family ATPase [Candidatus Hydrogenedentota bacterium]